MTAVDTRLAVAAARAANRLEALGNDPETIAAALLAAGVTGRRGSSTGCPVARYLTAEVRLGCVVVGKGYTFLSLTGVDEQTHIPTPPAVHAFLVAFDDGAYPHLISGGAW